MASFVSAGAAVPRTVCRAVARRHRRRRTAHPDPGRTHFHIFGSLAWLALFLDWKVLVRARRTPVPRFSGARWLRRNARAASTVCASLLGLTGAATVPCRGLTAQTFDSTGDAVSGVTCGGWARQPQPPDPRRGASTALRADISLHGLHGS